MKIANDILIPELARLLAEGKEVRFTPSGVSMRPFIEGDQDSVILKALTRPPRRGDILLAQTQTLCGQTTYVLHRLIRIENDTYVLQGDGNLAGEECCALGDIIGHVTRIETPTGRRKPLTRGYLWHLLKPVRNYLLKLYRHSILKLYKNENN
jgi:hypothetical protein